MTSLYLVDDHPIVREGLRAVLEASGYEVVGESGDVTVAAQDVSRLVPDVVLLDLSLGEASGLDLLMTLKRREIATKVIVLTVSDQPRHIGEAVRLGASGYLLKGSSSAEVMRAIETVMAGRSHFSEAIAQRATDASAGTPPADPFSTLSSRERQILERVVRGMSSAAIGEQLHLSPKTVDTYRSRLMAKLGVHDIASLVRLAVREGIIDSGSS